MGKNPTTSYTLKITPEQVRLIKAGLESRGFEFDTVPYAHFRARGTKVNVVAYESGKLVVQGKGTEELVQFFLEPEVMGEARMGYEHLLDDSYFDTRIGVDESGKGDFFGPLITAGLFVNERIAASWEGAGIQDSKTISSGKRVQNLAGLIRATPGAEFKLVVVGNLSYNRLQAKMGTVNKLLGWAHARAIEDVLSRADAPKAISDQFGNPKLIQNALMKKGRTIELIQRHKAESDLAVAGASILARYEFLRRMDMLQDKWGLTLPRGASAQVRKAAVEFVKKHGPENLIEVAKTHFRTAEQVLEEAGLNEAERTSVKEEWQRKMDPGE